MRPEDTAMAGGDTGPSVFQDQTPAFPIVVPEDWKEIRYGMTLRDYFAAKVLEGMSSLHPWPTEADFRLMAERSYGLADAMLAERAK